MQGKIWRIKQGRIVDIANLSDFDQAADMVLPGQFSTESDLQTVLDCFFEKAKNESLGKNIRSQLKQPYRLSSMDAAEKWLQKDVCQIVEKIKDGRYLREPGAKYIASAKAIVEKELSGAQEHEKGKAFAYLTLISWAFAQKAETMKRSTIVHLLAAWKPITETIYITGGESFSLSLDVDEKQPLVRKLLVNDSGICVTMNIIDPKEHKHSVLLPPHTRKLALFAGRKMTCIKSTISADGDSACALIGNRLHALNASASASLRCGGEEEELTDYTNRSRLCGMTLVRDESKTTDTLTVFDAGEKYCFLKKDGTLVSSWDTQNGRKGLCVLKEGEDLYVVLRGGEVITTAKQALCADEILSRMLSRFDAGKYAERVNVGGGAFVMTKDGLLRFIENG